jgi:hypothetical protein
LSRGLRPVLFPFTEAFSARSAEYGRIDQRFGLYIAALS